MQIELRRLLRELGITAVFVTHDQDEALTMSDRIAVMNKGAIEQLAVPAAIYRSPATAFALEFVGLSSRLFGTVVGQDYDHVIVDTAFGPLRAPGSFVVGASVMLAVRPERITVDSPGDYALVARLRDAVFQGSKVQLHFETQGSDQLMVETADLSDGLPLPGTEMKLGWAVADTLIYPAS
jgi:putative spermidine/putrescine transport system ATP-binding protein